MHRLHLAALGLLGGALLIWLGAMSLVLSDANLPDAAAGKMLAVFGPLRPAEESFAAIVKAGGRPVRPVAGFIWVTQSDRLGFAGRLRAQGARAVYGEFTFGPALAGCIAYIGGKPARPPSLL